MLAPTASAMPRVIACSGSLHLPQDKSEPSAAAKRGTMLHKYIEDALVHGVDYAREQVQPRSRVNLPDVGAIREYIGGSVFHVEQELCYDVDKDTASFVPREPWEERRRYRDKKYSGKIYGTADLIIERSTGLEAVDFKSGADIGEPRDNWQLRTLGLMTARAYLQNRVSVNVLYINKDGSISADKRVGLLCEMELNDIAHDIRTQLASATFQAGDHCRYCNAKRYCLYYGDQ